MTETIDYLWYKESEFETIIETETHYYALRGNWTEGLAVGDEFVKNESNNDRAILVTDKWYDISSILIKPSIGFHLMQLITTAGGETTPVMIRKGIPNASSINKVKLSNIEFIDGEFFADVHGTYSKGL